MRIAINGAATKLSGTRALGLNGIMSSALSALQTNTAALRVVANNISNVNTPDYARRQVDLQTLSAGGQLGGVSIADIQRVVDQFLNQESLSATSSSSRFDVQSSTFDQVSAMLGSPGDGTALTSRLSDIFKALGQAELSTTTPSSQNAVVSAMNNLANSISQVSDSLTTLQSQIDSQVVTAVSSVNSYTKQICDLNNMIKLATAQGQTDSAYLDQRDSAVAALAKLIDVRAVQQGDGSVLVTTQDGVSLVGGTYTQLSYGAALNGGYSTIQIQDIDARTGQPVGRSQVLDPHLSGGSIKGLTEVRDGTLANLKSELGAFAQGVSLAFNRVHNANSAYPPPQTLTGRNTGLLAADSLNFTGTSDIIITDGSGVKQHVVTVDFSAGTIAVDGGGGVAFTKTVGGLATALNGSVAGFTASFADGQLSLSASANQGLVVADPLAGSPSSRGGLGFSQFFGLNDLFQSSAPSIVTSGVKGTDNIGLSADASLTLQIKSPSGVSVKTATINVAAPSGGTDEDFATFMGDLNGSLAGFASFNLNADGSVSTTLNPAYAGYTVEVTNDTTSRGTTGISLSSLFGLGADFMSEQAIGFSVNPAILNKPALISFARANIDSTGAVNTQVVGAGDSTGLLALQSLSTAQQAFAKAGALGSQVTTLVNYGAALYQDVATRSATTKTNQTTQDDRLSEAQSRMSNNSGVSIDEELSNMMMYQQAYNAGARMLTIVNQLYDTLMQIV
jgi:flagellar hook-associated protein 1 FlgK